MSISNEAAAEIRAATSEIEGSGKLRALEGELRSMSSLLGRLQWFRQAGITFNGARDLYSVLGYKDILTTRDYRSRYARGGIAGRIVDALPDAAWRGEMWLQEEGSEDGKPDTKFELAWTDLDRRLQIQAKLQRVNKLSRLSNYAVLLIGTSVNGDLEQPLPKGKPDDLIYLTPFLGAGGPGINRGTLARSLDSDADATICEYDVDPQSVRFGLPLKYFLKRLDINAPVMQRPVHWTRLLHVAENLLEDDVYGPPSLERAWNLLDDLDKVTGGGAEAFWLRANQGLHMNVDKEMSTAILGMDEPKRKVLLDGLKDASEDYKHQLTRWLRTYGTDVKTLGSDVANFQSPADAVLTQIAGATAMPKRILTGSEMGELASSQDRDNWKDQVNGYQTQQLGPNLVRPFAARLIEYGYLDAPQKGPDAFDVKWPHVQTLTEEERAAGADKWAGANQKQGVTIFTGDEIRDHWYGMPPLAPEDVQVIAKTSVKDQGTGSPVPTDLEDGEMLRVLEEALATGNAAVVNEIVGLPPVRTQRREVVVRDDRGLIKERIVVEEPVGAEPLALQHSYATTQIQLPSPLREQLLDLAASIPDEDLAEKGREADPHVTVKYGLINPDQKKLAGVMAYRGPVSLTLGRTSYFSTPGYDVIIVEVNGQALSFFNKAIGEFMNCAPSDHDAYVPHATVAYVKPGLGPRYAGRTDLQGKRIVADALTLVLANDERFEVGLC